MGGGRRCCAPPAPPATATGDVWLVEAEHLTGATLLGEGAVLLGDGPALLGDELVPGLEPTLSAPFGDGILHTLAGNGTTGNGTTGNGTTGAGHPTSPTCRATARDTSRPTPGPWRSPWRWPRTVPMVGQACAHRSAASPPAPCTGRAQWPGTCAWPACCGPHRVSCRSWRGPAS